ncbi:rho GTPase-activating protein [Actinomortierella ambigua]|nr:rho GTPase-activating protein [Actinomortierella ambigua]
MSSTNPSSGGGLSKDKSPKASSSSTNIVQPQQHPENGPRKTVSHEGFQHSKSASQSATLDSKTAHTPPPHSSSSSLSAFSYLKQKLFGTVADASSSLSSSARDLLQSKKSQSSDTPKAKAASKDTSGPTGAPTAAGSSSPASTGGRSRFGAKTLPSRQQAQALQQHLGASGSGTVGSTTHTTSSQHSIAPSTPSAVSPTISHSRSPHSSPISVTATNVTTDHIPTNSNTSLGKLSPSYVAPSVGQSQLVTHSTRTHAPATPSRVSYSQARNSNYRLSTLSSHKSVPTTSIIYQEGLLNKKADLQPGEIGHGWKVYKVILRGTKLYFFKPLPFEEKPRFQEPRDNQRQIEGFATQPSPSRLSLTNESGMVLTAFKFESSTRTLLFEGNPRPLHPQSWAAAPLVSKYIYGECFTELDRMSMQPKKHVALLLFEDCIVICRRKWIRFPSAKMKDVMKFNSQKEPEDRSPVSTVSQPQQRRFGLNVNSARSTGREQQERPAEKEKEKQRGYFTKWKHEAMYSLSQVEALDMASPVPSASNTFFPFVTPSISSTSGVENPPPVSTLSVPFIHQTTSTLELIITSSIDGKEYTQRLLFLPPSPEVRHMWYSKFHRTKERFNARSRTTDSRGSVDSAQARESLTVRSMLPSNHSAQSLASTSSPSRPSFDHSLFLDPSNTEKSRVFSSPSLHPELQTSPSMNGAERLAAASVQGLVHELVFHNIPDPGMDVLSVFMTTMPLFATNGQVFKTLQQIVAHSDNPEAPQRAVQIVQARLRGFNVRADSVKVLDGLQSFVKDTLASRLKDDGQIATVLSEIDRIRSTELPLAIQISVSTTESAETSSVDLSNVLITGLTPALFLRLDPDHFAEQIFHYHASRLNDAGGLVRLLENPAFFMRRYPTAGAKPCLQSPLVFSMFSPHFLTVLITHHILIATQSVQSQSRRPMLLAHWIKTGRCCRSLGDMVGFVAIAIGICSPGIVRLQETWKDIDQELRDEVTKSWIQELVEMEMITEDWQGIAASAIGSTSGQNMAESIGSHSKGHEGVAIPCMSRIKQAIDILDRNQPSFVQATPTPLLNVDKLNAIANVLDGAKHDMAAMKLRSDVTLQHQAISHIQQYFGHLASISQSLHDQFHSNELINDAFESSLACEPHFNGQYLDYHYKNRKLASSYIPLLFPESIPTHRLFHQQTLLTLENAGNACRKSSMDEQHDHLLQSPTGIHSSGSPFRKNVPVSGAHLATNAQPDWAKGDATLTHHHGAMHLGGVSSGGSLGYPRTRKRTYSFPPSRVASRESTVVGGHSLRTIVNMINPNLDIVTREWLLAQSSQTIGDQGSNEILQAMQDLAGTGCKLLLMEGGELILKVKDESLDSLSQSVMVDNKNDSMRPWSPLPPQQQPQSLPPKSPGLQTHHQIHGSNRSSAVLSIHGGKRLVTVKAGTLEMLVQVLVMGLQGMNGYLVDDAGGAMLLTSRQLVFDHRVYASSFFATYRSFCSAGGLLEHLVTMFTFAQQSTLSRATSSGIPSSLNLFSRPITMSPDNSIVISAGTNSAAATDRSASRGNSTGLRNVLSTIEYWLIHHVSDFLDHLALKDKLCEGLNAFSVQEQTQTVLIDASLADEVAALKEQLIGLKRLALQQTMRPLVGPLLPKSLERLRDYLGTPPSTEPTMDNPSMDAQTLLEQMNLAALRHFLSIGQQEWFVLFEILESQSTDPLGWYVGKPGSSSSSSSSSEDELVITNMDHLLYSIRRSGVAGSHWNGERLIHAIPMCLQKLCKLHHTLRSWVVSQVADPNISYETRLSRVQRFVDVVLLNREEMHRFDLQARDTAAGSTLSSVASVSTSRSGGGGGGSSSGNANRRPSIDFNKIRKLPSFVESAVVSALISPESRVYSRVWHDVAASRHGSVDSFEDMLGDCVILSPGPTASSSDRRGGGPGALLPRLVPATAQEALVPSVGWLIERMVEACCYVRDMSYESSILVNFDKRRYIYDLVQVFIRQQQVLDQAPAPLAQPLASWLALAAGTSPTNLNFKVIRETSIKESQAGHSRLGSFSAAIGGGGSGSSGGGSGGGHRHQNSRSGSRGAVFGRLIAAQQEKTKRDLKEYEKLERQIKETQGRIQKAQQEHAKSLEKQIKMEQSRSRVKNQLLKTTLLRAVRPISLAISNSFSLATTTVSNATAQGMPVTPTNGSRGAAAAAAVAAGGSHTSEASSESSAANDSSLGARLLGQTRLDDPRRPGANAMTLGAAPNIQPRSTSLSGSNGNGQSNGNNGGCGTVAAKPALVINLINASCSIAYTYTKRDYVFKIVMEEGHQSLLQALDYDDMLRWINIINEAAAEATAKRRTLLEMDEGQQQQKQQQKQDPSEGGTQSPTQAETSSADAAAEAAWNQEPVVFEDVALAIDVNERKSRKSVFGVELRHLMPDGRIPEIVEKCISEIEKRGLDEVGIYRVPGAVSAINKLRTAFNTDSAAVDLESDEWKDINVVAGALKQFLRELPEAVMTSALYDSLIAASALEDYDERLMTIKDLVHMLPLPNYLLLKRIIEHLERVTDFEEINHMYATNLAIVFGPTLVRPGGASASSFARSMKNLGHQQAIVKNMILQYHWLFDVEQEGGREEDSGDGEGDQQEEAEEEGDESPDSDAADEADEDGEEGEDLYDAGDDEGQQYQPFSPDANVFHLRLPQQRKAFNDQELTDLRMAQPVTDTTVDKLARDQRRRTVIFGFS